MSVFQESSTTGTGESQETQQQSSETTEDYIARVAQEKGEHWKDPQTLAKGYYHAQQRIAELEQKAEELGKQDYAKELLAQLQTQTPKDDGKSGVSDQSEVRQEEEKTTPTPEDIESLIEKTLTQREKENTAKQNLAQVDKDLTDAFGTEANSVVKQKASELGMSLDKLQELASESPSAFMALMGSPKPKETNTLPKGQTNTESMKFNSPSNERTWSYYNKLRKENPKLYRSAQVQQQMIEDRQRMGGEFNK